MVPADEAGRIPALASRILRKPPLCIVDMLQPRWMARTSSSL